MYLEGIVPTIEAYSGSNGVPGANGIRLGFSGGNVTVNTVILPGTHTSISIPQGFSRNYSMLQQGLTANVTCQPMNSQMQYGWNTSQSSVVYTNPSPNNTITGLRVWNITANCSSGGFGPRISCFKFTVSS